MQQRPRCSSLMVMSAELRNLVQDGDLTQLRHHTSGVGLGVFNCSVPTLDFNRNVNCHHVAKVNETLLNLRK